MAERTSSRAGSRRTTPQPAPQSGRVRIQSPPKRMTRKTRSQSRDISDNEDGRTGVKPRRGAKQTTPDGTNGFVRQSGPKSRKGKPADRARVLQDLSMVAEEPSALHHDPENAEDSDPAKNVKDVGVGQQPIQQNHRSSGDISGYSGTTARTSRSAQELTGSSPEGMLDTLPDLSDASEKLLNFIIPADQSEATVARSMAQLQNKLTRENKNLKRLSEILERQRREYGGDSYINVQETLRRLLGRKAAPINEQTASWRPDALLQKANLAILVSRMLSIAEQDRNDQFLEDIAGTFPQPFMQRLGLPESLTPECSALAEATLQVALEFRTQEAITLLARYVGKSNFDPDSAVLQVFYDGNKLKGWAVSGLRTADLRREAKEKIVGRVKQLRETFGFNVAMSSDSESAGIESLRVIFPWTSFAQQMLAWARQRLTEIKIQTTIHGPGAQDICREFTNVINSGKLGQSLESDVTDDESDGTELRLELDTPDEPHAAFEQQVASTRSTRADGFNLPQFNPDSKRSKDAAALLIQRRAVPEANKATKQGLLPQNQKTHSDVQVASTAGPSIRTLTPQRNSNEQVISTPAPFNLPNRQMPSADQNDSPRSEDNEEEEEDKTLEGNAQASLAFRKEREAESNKENVPEAPEPQQAKITPKRSIYERDPLAGRVSPIDGQDSDNNSQETEISSDEGFQVQAESSNAATLRRSKPAAKRPASEPARLQRRSPKKVRIQENTDAQTFNVSAVVARGEQETEFLPSQAFEEYVRVNKSAKQKMAVVTKQPQRRSAWTGEETDMLYYLITEYGTSWKLLKEQDFGQDYILEARDQVALKDKARNMKMDYLKAGRVLPQNFERIPLSQLQIKRLRDGGVDYDPETGARVDAEVID